MSLHPLMKKYLEQAPSKPLGYVPTVEEMRKSKFTFPEEARPPVHSVKDWYVPGKVNIPLRIYSPQIEGPLPILMYFHGGGFVRGSIDGHDIVCRTLANTTGHIIISVGYRLAPENPFPAGLEDSYEATVWAYHNANKFSGDRENIVVAGDSAGGTFAAAVCLMAKDRGFHGISKQVLIYPATHYHKSVNSKDSYASYKENGQGYFLTLEILAEYWRLYAQNVKKEDYPYLAPLNASTLKGLPPALIITAEFDPIRDEGEHYAKRLHADGVPTILKRYDGVIHGFLNIFNVFNAKDNIEDLYLLITDFLNDSFDNANVLNITKESSLK